MECIEVRRKEIFKAVVFKTITSKVAFLHNYDWSVSVVLSSDKMNNIKEPIMKLSLLVHHANSSPDQYHHQLVNQDKEIKNVTDEDSILFFSSNSLTDSYSNIKTISCEFTKKELSSFIHTLEEAKHALTQAISV